jgi:polyphosphate kinase
VPSEDNVHQLARLLDLAFAPTTYAWTLASDGDWAPNGGPDHLQEMLIERQRRPRVVP